MRVAAPLAMRLAMPSAMRVAAPSTMRLAMPSPGAGAGHLVSHVDCVMISALP